jgi:DUF1707 SHOCT-like domain
MDDRMRASDAEREAVTARLRDHYAEGRLTQDELDERVSAALGSKTFGDLRALTTDLPGPAPVPPRTAARPPWGGLPPWRHRHRPPVLLFALIALLVLLTSGGGWVLFGLFRIVLVIWLVSNLVRFTSGYRRGHRWH